MTGLDILDRGKPADMRVTEKARAWLRPAGPLSTF